jgi:hypothetical protein
LAIICQVDVKRHTGIYSWEYYVRLGGEELRGAKAINGEGPVERFRLDLAPVWRGL